ncbi:hypothetical protein [Robertkochia solimangrovi]|uniref:hypothetical protein n=1 Tax=Robertkochia solimangrovi TaxID=2213046 RepID=UPI0011816BDD|nr:hypothetical protein [Robertkochia solimangrovi]TRZ43650.1 hypothetical protein DMZ48_09550 [Robertkochia solimangrovi]
MASVNHIEALLEKYFEADTSIAEEKVLQDYFNSDEVAPHLEQYASMFQFFKISGEERSTRAIPLKPGRKVYLLKWISVAAVAALLVGIFINQPSQTDSLQANYTQEELESAQMALAIFSENFNKGTQGMSYLKEFEKNTNKFLK